MPVFSKISQERLSTCDPRLQEICNEAIKDFDFMVVCGHRGESDQNKAFSEGKSRLKYPDSKHNTTPSLAVDLAPLEHKDGKAVIPWDDIEAFRKLAMHIMNIANNKGIPLEWGGNWIKFKDYPHFQISTKEA